VTWLTDLLGAGVPARAIEVEQTRIRIEADSSSEYEQRAVAHLTEAEQHTDHSPRTAALLGIGWAVLAVVEQLRDSGRAG
jgi:hypothetical protein